VHVFSVRLLPTASSAPLPPSTTVKLFGFKRPCLSLVSQALTWSSWRILLLRHAVADCFNARRFSDWKSSAHQPEAIEG